MPDIRTLSNIEKVLDAFGEKVVKLTNDGLPNTKDATMALRHSIHFQITHFGFKYNFQMLLEDYYINVNDGRKPNSTPPPVSKIMKWIRDKRLIITNGKLQVRKKQTLKVQLLADGARLQSMSYAIAKNIGKHGIRPIPFVTNATRPEIIEKLREDLAAAVSKDITVEIKELVNDYSHKSTKTT